MLSQAGDFSQHSHTGYYLATVVFNQDPLFLQRIKVSIPYLLGDNPADLPWISPMHPPGVGIHTSGSMRVEVPPVGSQVVVQFQEGNLMYGLSVGSIPSSVTEMPPSLKTNYPNRRGYKDAAGNIFYYDSTSKVVSFTHSSGTTVQIGGDGSVLIQGVSGSTNITLKNGSSSIIIEDSKISISSPRIDLN